MMERIWQERFEIKSYHVDFQQKLKPSVLMQFFQEAAANHASELGAGYQVLSERGLFWALSRIRVEITRMPHWDESVLIETWPCGNEGLFFRRDFIVCDKDQQVIIRGVSGWLLVEGQTLRPQRPARLGIDLPANTGLQALADFPGRVSGQAASRAFSKVVAYNEIDQNLHVNNTRYLDWATDCFQLKHYQDFMIAGFVLEFLSETHWGDEIDLMYGSDGTKSYIEGLDRMTGSKFFKATFRFISFSR